MAVRQMDAISSFQHVVENVPQWKTQLTELSTYAAAKHEEYVAEYARIINNVKHKRQKSASVASIRTGDEEEEEVEIADIPSRSPQPSDLAEINPLEAGNRFIYAQARRKRRPGTSLRSNASGPRHTNSKQMVVILYDSHIQSELDKLVKGFGAARNNLRKGRNAYTVGKGFSLPGLSRRYDMDNLVPNLMSRSSPRLTKAQSDTTLVTSTNPPSAESGFATTDKELDSIQSLCETAAHQAIRDGDCKVELRDAKGKLDALLALAESTLELLKAEKEKEDEEEALSGEGSGASQNTSAQSTLCEKPSSEAMYSQHKVLPPVIESLGSLKRPPLATISSAPAGPITIDAIEVDDDDDDDDSSMDIDLNLASYRSPGRRIVAS